MRVRGEQRPLAGEGFAESKMDPRVIRVDGLSDEGQGDEDER
jgi:hypothetical protein